MRNPLSKTIVTIQPSGIRKFFDIVNEMEDAISLGVGEPDFDTPWHIREEGIYSLEKGRTFYTSNAGLKELKQEILSIDGVTDIIPSRQSLHATYKTEIHQAGGMCDMLTDQNYAAVEAALTEGTMPTDSRSIVIDYNVLKQNEDMGVGSTVEISLGEEQPSVSVTISGL